MRKGITFLFVWLIACFGAWAQSPCFLAYNEQNVPVQTFCVGERITFKDNSGQSNVVEFYDFDDRNGLDFSSSATSHTFTTPGTFVITQLANGFNQCQRTFQVKAQRPDSPPVLQSLSVTTSGLQLKIQSSAINDLVLERAASPTGTFTAVETFSAVPSGQSDRTVTVAQTGGCFRLRVTNVCTGEENIVSNTVCVQSISVTAGDRQNQLFWTANTSPAALSNYQIIRGGQPYQTLPPNQNSFTDAQVACGRQYTYSLAAVFTDGAQSTSAPVQVETQGTTPPSAPILLVSFNLQNQIVLETIVPEQETFKEQALFRSLNGGAFDLISEKQPQNALDTTLPDLSQRPCYQTAYTDSCSLVSPRSNTACPALLAATYRTENGAVALTWSPYEGFPNGIESQTLELLDEQGNVYWSTTVSGQSYVHQQLPQTYQRLSYRLLSSSEAGNLQSASNTATIDQPFQFFFPTAFSPNGDGLNDVFRAVGPPFASTFKLQVLNRWGQIIFESNSPQSGWDGTYNSKPAPPETYLYRFEATDVNGQRITKSGKITLVR
ncbi:T9SS type B sorting domain-containing protein [Rufibacter roseus]|uniref:T9SS type B sorting domain-containing protein n=1 Tax=Rufibacter roseus TaxID=1567108 RepID=A0ABW2DNC4_9BACT|nr:T9SS type B sorting domain-containing protein [Rufibacter roseus]